jgi:hypothetical protein
MSAIAPLSEVTSEAIALLCRELGVVNTMRFLNQYSNGHGDYVHERKIRFGNMTVEQLAHEIRRNQTTR